MSIQLYSVSNWIEPGIRSCSLDPSIIFSKLSDLVNEYPGFENWYYQKVIPQVVDGSRIIIIAEYEGYLSGIAILKRTLFEKKICTLRVMPKYQRLGIGRELLGASCNFLGDDKPLITVSSGRLSQFNRLFKSFGFCLTDVKEGYYKADSAEYVYNGYLNGAVFAPENCQPGIIH